MRRSIVGLVVLASLIAGCGSGSGSSDGKGETKSPLANAVSIDSAVDVSLAASKFVPVNKPVPVDVGDVVRTDDSGFAEVTYRDGSVSRLDVDSELTVVALSDGPDGSSVRTKMGVGRTWHRVEKLGDGDEFSVKTSVATATVRGTAFAIDCPDKKTCTFVVFEGVVELKLRDGRTVELRAGQQSTVTTEATPAADTDPATVYDIWIARNEALDASAKSGGSLSAKTIAGSYARTSTIVVGSESAPVGYVDDGAATIACRGSRCRYAEAHSYALEITGSALHIAGSFDQQCPEGHGTGAAHIDFELVLTARAYSTRGGKKTPSRFEGTEYQSARIPPTCDTYNSPVTYSTVLERKD